MDRLKLQLFLLGELAIDPVALGGQEARQLIRADIGRSPQQQAAIALNRELGAPAFATPRQRDGQPVELHHVGVHTWSLAANSARLARASSSRRSAIAAC